MTSEERKRVSLFEAKVRMLIEDYQTLQAQNEQLQQVIAEKDKQIGQLNATVSLHQQNYENLKTAKMMEISDGDIASARQRITKLVREINRCIALLQTGEATNLEETK